MLKAQPLQGVLAAHDALHDIGNRFAYTVIGNLSDYKIKTMPEIRIASVGYNEINPFE